MINSTPSPWVPKLEVSKDACISSPLLLQAPPLVSLETSLSQGSKVQFTCIISSWSKMEKKKQRVPWCQLLTVRAIVICLMIWYDLNNGLNGCLLLQIHTLALFLLGGQDRKAMTCDMWQAPFISQSHLNPRSWIVAQIAGNFSWSFWESIHLQEHHLATFFCKVTTSRHAWQWSALVSSRRFRTSWASYVDRLESRSHRVSKKVSLETNLNGI